ncbi:hypothetical protein M011DRAFT_463066 [Sporormia fimetaria CBS 119925]|uniref:Uncharacterized protein n=1 Tax=Sporormia fimetaria CBS 119925 TaxID=1340428 RepID=A0A6A6UXD9_9PLEO|nr:hypothetical protein M011DRAFT_463066 [Sporormia fimetaria CBS 119925]
MTEVRRRMTARASETHDKIKPKVHFPFLFHSTVTTGLQLQFHCRRLLVAVSNPPAHPKATQSRCGQIATLRGGSSSPRTGRQPIGNVVGEARIAVSAGSGASRRAFGAMKKMDCSSSSNNNKNNPAVQQQQQQQQQHHDDYHQIMGRQYQHHQHDRLRLPHHHLHNHPGLQLQQQRRRRQQSHHQQYDPWAAHQHQRYEHEQYQRGAQAQRQRDRRELVLRQLVEIFPAYSLDDMEDFLGFLQRHQLTLQTMREQSEWRAAISRRDAGRQLCWIMAMVVGSVSVVVAVLGLAVDHLEAERLRKNGEPGL